MILIYLIGIVFGISLIVIPLLKKRNKETKENSISFLFYNMGCIILFVIGLMILINGFPYITSLTEEAELNDGFYLFAHTDRNISVASSGYWYNITFDDCESFKQRVNHTFDDLTNNTFIIAYDGVYSFDYAAVFEDTSASPNAHVEMRIVRNDVEINGSLIEQDSTKQYSAFSMSKGIIVELDSGDDIKFQFTSDDTTVKLASHNIYGIHKDTATIQIEKIASINTTNSSIKSEKTVNYNQGYDTKYYSIIFGIIICLIGVGLMILKSLKDIGGIMK